MRVWTVKQMDGLEEVGVSRSHATPFDAQPDFLGRVLEVHRNSSHITVEISGVNLAEGYDFTIEVSDGFSDSVLLVGTYVWSREGSQPGALNAAEERQLEHLMTALRYKLRELNWQVKSGPVKIEPGASWNLWKVW